jgi:hypothetical protein
MVVSSNRKICSRAGLRDNNQAEEQSVGKTRQHKGVRGEKYAAH